MATVSALGFVIITAILCRGTTARVVSREGEVLVPESQEADKPCDKLYDDCIKRSGDVAYLTPPTNADGSLHFPDDFFDRVCGYFTNASVCYKLTTPDDCEPDFPPNNMIKNMNIISIKLCRNTEALNTLVPCLNDKEFYKAFWCAIEYVGREKESRCNLDKEELRRVLRLFKERCGEAEYTNLKTVMEDFGENLRPELDDPSCTIDVNFK